MQDPNAGRSSNVPPESGDFAIALLATGILNKLYEGTRQNTFREDAGMLLLTLIETAG